ncbi:MAG: DUF2442 domain-containing protein [Betaproteobacteria bacterium]|nr:DUF2442 domain-containing protein [Betaproteobacteria bacterium]
MELVTRVQVREDFHLELTFNTGETRLFDARPYLEKGVFQRLKDPTLFRQAYVAFDTVCWPGNLDIAPETLYDRSRAVAAHAPK